MKITLKEKTVAQFFTFVALVSMIVFLTTTYEWANFNSDSAVKVLLAQEMYETKSFFPPTWNYYNGDLFIFYGNAVIALLLPWLNPGFLTHSISGLIFAAFFFTATWLLLNQVNASQSGKWAAMAVICSGISLPITEQLWAQTGNGIVYGWLCIFLYLTVRLMLNPKGSGIQSYHLTAIFISILILTWSNPIRAAFFYFFPIGVALALALIKFSPQFHRIRSTNYKLLFVIIAGAATGYVLREITKLEVSMNSGYAGEVRWRSVAQASEALQNLPFKIFTLLGSEPVPATLIFSSVGAYQALKLMAGIMAAALIMRFIILGILGKCVINYFMALFVLISTFQLSFLLVFTSLNHINYLIPTIVLSLVLMTTEAFNRNDGRIIKYIRNITLFIIFTNSVAIHYRPIWTNFHVLDPLVTSFGEFGNPDQLLNYLKKNNLMQGYSTFWRAGRLTVLSDGVVKVRSIEIDNGKIAPDLHLSSRRWYLGNTDIKQTFLILNKNEEKNISWEHLRQSGLVIDKILPFGSVNIFVFNDDLARYLK